MDIAAAIKKANQILNRVKISTYKQSDRLYIRGSQFPPKPGDRPGKRYAIATGYRANGRELKMALALAQKIDGQLMLGEFDWQPYLKGDQRRPETIGEWLERLEKEYWSKRDRNPNTENTWRKSYWQYLKRLPMEQALSIELLEEAMLERYPAATRSRQLCAVAFGMLGEFAGIGRGRLWELGKGYQSSKVAANDVLPDHQIEALILGCRSPTYRWVAGMVATFGLRPHEIMRLDTTEVVEGLLQIEENSKTGRRLTVAVPIEWVQRFDLTSVRLPKIDPNQANNAIGSYISKKFKRWGLPNPYSFRDAWAIRAEIEQIANSSIIAGYMGHSIKVHEDHYLDAVKEIHNRAAYSRYRKRISTAGQQALKSPAENSADAP